MRGHWIKYTQEQLDWVKEHCTLVIGDLHAKFCQTFDRHDVSAQNLNALRKRNGWKTGRTGQFQKGNVPHPDAHPGGPNATSFRKGNVPANTRPMYSERINKDGYIEIKVPEPNPHTGAKTRFRHKHVWVWEKANGPVPESHVIVFKDGDRQNCDLANLECVHRRVLQQLNKKFRPSEYPKELRPSLLAVSKVNAVMAQRAKEQS